MRVVATAVVPRIYLGGRDGGVVPRGHVSSPLRNMAVVRWAPWFDGVYVGGVRMPPWFHCDAPVVV